MQDRVVEFVRTSLNARQVAVEAQLQALWGGQGFLFRVSTDVPGHNKINPYTESLVVRALADRSGIPKGQGDNIDFD